MNKLASIASMAAVAGLVAFPAAASAAPTAPTGYTLQTFATAPSGSTGPDDVTYLDGHVFVGWQNGVGTKGEPGPTGQTASTLVEYDRSGNTVQSWQLTGKVDGLAADPEADQVVATVNEDGNSSLYTVRPSGHSRSIFDRSGNGVIHYTYSPAPDSATTGGVFTGGGTDAVTVYRGQIVLSASNPTPANATAAFRVRLDRHRGVARLIPTFADNAAATDAVTGKPVTLALTDPDSNAVVPESSPRFGGDFVLDSQGDQQLIFADGLGHHASGLERLALTHGGTSAGVDDIRWADRTGGTLYIVDNKTGTIYSLTGPFSAGEAFAALDTVGSASQTTELDTIDLQTGALSPLVTGFTGIKGVVWAPGGAGKRGRGSEGHHGHHHGGPRH
ncbi:MAG TPA: hypothetical protein VHZ27_21150 [Solirubrobacteraceae bacterium]|jgi:hypothetical protein|nr:hypothetical protein [Solirubrobacteraceae bacterium]